MTEKIAHRIALYFEQQGVVEPAKRDLAEYGIFHFLSSALHITFLIVAGKLCSVLLETTVFCLCFCTIKHYIGGAHAKKHWVCLWGFTFLSTFTSVSISHLNSVELSVLAAPIISITALGIILLRAPVLHSNSPKYPRQKLKEFRRKGIMISCIQFVVICLLTCNSQPVLALCGSAGSMAASVSLLLPMKTKGRRTHDEKKVTSMDRIRSY